MLKIKTTNDKLLGPLQQVTGIVERRHTLPILSNVLIPARVSKVQFLATDLEVQITSQADLDSAAEGSVTAGARKLYDSLRSLPEDVEVSLEAKENRMTVRAGKSRFNLQTLAAADFPKMVEAKDASRTLTLPQKALKNALGLVQFAMAVQDIRYYLNGVLFSIDKDVLRVVATDGHRLSYASESLGSDHGSVEAILPRKTVLELTAAGRQRRAGIARHRLEPGAVLLRRHRDRLQDRRGKFPSEGDPDAQEPRPPRPRHARAVVNRAAILSNEKIRGAPVFTKDGCRSSARTTSRKSRGRPGAGLRGDALDIGFNISYLLDVLNHDSPTVT